MKCRRTTRALTFRDHVLGTGLLLVALATLGLIPMLPARGATGLELPFLDDTGPPVVVAFAGFPGCGTVCPTSLALLSGVYRDIQSPSEDIRLMFVNIQRDTPDQITTAYARAFHPEFRAYSISSADADDVYRSLSLLSFDDDNRAVQHTGFIYLFVRENEGWRIEHVYRKLPSSNRLKEDLVNLVEAT